MSEPIFHTLGGIQDHSFEAELDNNNFPDWTFSGSGSFTRETYLQYDGDSYTIITAEQTGNHIFYQDLSADDLEVGKTYFLSFRYKILDENLTVGTGGGARIQLAILGGEDDGKIYAATKPATILTGGDWVSIKVAFTARSQNSRLSVGIWDALGKLAIDDVRINPMEDSVGAAVNNPGFEALGNLGTAPYGWTATLNGGSIHTLDGELTGRSCVQLRRTHSGNTILSQSFSFPSDQKTPYQGYISYKLDTVGNVGATLRIYQTVQGGTQDLFVSDVLTGSSDWKQLSFNFKTIIDESDTYQLTIELNLADTGTIYFDGLMLRRKPILAYDFKDDWEAHWVVAGDGTADTPDYKLTLYNDSLGNTTTASQNIHLIEGLPCMIGGSLQVSATVATNQVGGAYISVYDLDKDELIEEIGPFTDEDEWYWWSISAAFDYLESPSAQRYRVRFELRNCSGTLKIGDLNGYVVEIPALLTVVPQPTMPPSGSGILRSIYSDDGTTTTTLKIVFSQNDSQLRRTVVDDLISDLTAAFDPNCPIPLRHSYDIPRTAINNTVDLADFYTPPTEPAGPAIVLGRYNGPTAPPSPIEELMGLYGIPGQNVLQLGDEGYIVKVNKDINNYPVILIVSKSYKGLYYGTQTLLQMITKNYYSTPSGNILTYTVPEYRVDDIPGRPIRLVYMELPYEYADLCPVGRDPKTQYKLDIFIPRDTDPGLHPDCGDHRSPIEAYIKFISRLKMNMVVIQSPIYYCLDAYCHIPGIETDVTHRTLLQNLDQYCKDRFITLVPGMPSMSITNILLQFEHTMLVEGVSKTFKLWYQAEAAWVGGDPNLNAVQGDRTYECLPMPQPAEHFKIEAGHKKYTFRNRFIIKDENFYAEDYDAAINSYCYGIKIEENWGTELDPDWHEAHPGGGANYIIHYEPLSFDAVNGYSCGAFRQNPDETDPEKWHTIPNHNVQIELSSFSSYDRVFRARYHVISPDRVEMAGDPDRDEHNIYDEQQHPDTNDDYYASFLRRSISYCPRSPVIQNFMDYRIGDVVGSFHPSYIYFGHEEPAQMHTCKRCFPEQDTHDYRYFRGDEPNRHRLSPNGFLFAEDIHHLRQVYDNYCDLEEIPHGKIIMQSCHICSEHESVKVPFNGPNAGDHRYNKSWKLWWDYRGNRYNWTPEDDSRRYYDSELYTPMEIGWVSTCKWMFNENGDTESILLLEYNYSSDRIRVSEDGTTDVWKNMQDWYKYKYINEFVNATPGLNLWLIGGTNGDPRGYNKDVQPGIKYPRPNMYDTETMGAIVYFRFHGSKKVNGVRQEWPLDEDKWAVFNCDLEGTFDSVIRLMEHPEDILDPKNPEHNPECIQDDNGFWWFSRYFDYFNLAISGLDPLSEPWVTKVSVYVDIYGIGPSGEFWVDDIELDVYDPIADRWHQIIGRDVDGVSGPQRNYSFEESGSGLQSFSLWDNPIYDGSTTISGLTIDKNSLHHIVDPWFVGTQYSYHHKSTNRRESSDTVGRLPRTIKPSSILDNEPIDADNYNPVPWYDFSLPQFEPVKQFEVAIDEQYKVLAVSPYRFQAYFRTKQVDTGRMIQPYEWRKSGGSRAIYKGGAFQNWAERGLPYDDTTNFKWKLHVALIGAAAWNWNANYPAKPYLSNMNFDPFVMLRKEVPWAGKA